MSEPHIPAWCCQRCGRRFELDNAHRPEPPEGDLVICAACGLCGIFTGEGWDARRPTPAEMAEIADNPEVVQIVMQIVEGRARAVAEGRERRRRAARWN